LSEKCTKVSKERFPVLLDVIERLLEALIFHRLVTGRAS
jgi:hypothetical protein